MPLQIVPYEPAHYLMIAPAVYPWLDTPGHPAASKIAMAYREGPAYSGLLDGALLGSAGVLIPWRGLGVAWAVISPLGRQHPVMVHRTVVRALRRIIDEHGLRRVEATVLADTALHARWVEAMGFEREAIMPAWGPEGETAYKYVLYPVHRRVEFGMELVSRAGHEFLMIAGAPVPMISGGTGVETGVLLGYIGTAAAVVGTGVATYSAYAQGQATEEAQKFSAKQAERQAAAAKEAAAVEAENRAEQFRRIQGTQRARVGGMGVTTEGSPLLAMMDTAEQAALDVARIRYGGELQAGELQTEATLRRFMGRQARRGGTLGAGATLLTGLGSAGMNLGRMRGGGGTKNPYADTYGGGYVP